jgi:hypothetical protein
MGWPRCVSRRCKLDETSESLVRAAMSQLQLSARAYHRILKLSRTIADLAGSDAIWSRIWQRRCSIVRRFLYLDSNCLGDLEMTIFSYL